MTFKFVLFTGVCAAAVVSANVQAQTAPLPADNSPKASPPASNPSSSPAIDNTQPALQPTAPSNAEQAPVADIVVTAQRRSESLARTPVAVSIISSDTLAKAQVVSTSDLREATPGLSVRASLSSEQLNFSLRGQSQDPFSNSRPGVLPYINEVQIGSQGSSSQLYDLQSVQVLKGPQGTLFGRSATGGAILYTTQKPTDKFGGYVSGLYGNYNQGKAEGAINVPLSGDDLLFRVAGFYSRRDGFQYNLYDGKHEGQQRKYGFRPTLTAKFGPNITNTLMVDYYHSNSQNTVGVISGILPYTGNGAPFVPATLLYSGTSSPAATFTGECTLQAFAGIPGACPPANPAVSGFYQSYFAGNGRPSSLQQALADQTARGPFVIDSDARNVAKNRNTILTNTTTADLTDNVQLKNIFGYIDNHSQTAFEADGTAFDISESGVKGSDSGIFDVYHSLSEELQLVGKGLDNKLDYVLGGYYSRERDTVHEYSALFDILFGGESQRNFYRISNDTRAGYGQLTYHLGDSGFSLTGGARYTSERVGKLSLPGDSFVEALGTVAPPGYSYDKHKTYGTTSWTAGVQYQASSTTMIYARADRAFKSGGFNGTVAPQLGTADTGGDAYGSERITAAEGGAKFNGRIGDMPARLNGAIYYNWVKDGQRAAFALVNGGPASLTVNVPSSRTYGVELDGQISPTRWLELGGNFNYTNAAFENGNVSILGLQETYDQVPDTPAYSAAVYANVTVPINEDLSATAHGDLYYQSSSTTSPRSFNYAGTHIPGYELANFRLGIESKSHGWSITGNVKNAFNKVYYAGGLQVGEIYQINTLVPGDPRTYTVEVRYKF